MKNVKWNKMITKKKQRMWINVGRMKKGWGGEKSLCLSDNSLFYDNGYFFFPNRIFLTPYEFEMGKSLKPQQVSQFKAHVFKQTLRMYVCLPFLSKTIKDPICTFGGFEIKLYCWLLCSYVFSHAKSILNFNPAADFKVRNNAAFKPFTPLTNRISFNQSDAMFLPTVLKYIINFFNSWHKFVTACAFKLGLIFQPLRPGLPSSPVLKDKLW